MEDLFFISLLQQRRRRRDKNEGNSINPFRRCTHQLSAALESHTLTRSVHNIVNFTTIESLCNLDANSPFPFTLWAADCRFRLHREFVFFFHLFLSELNATPKTMSQMQRRNPLIVQTKMKRAIPLRSHHSLIHGNRVRTTFRTEK